MSRDDKDRDFAKLFGAGADQVVAIRELDEEGNDAITFIYDPQHPDMEVSRTTISFEDEASRDEAWANATDAEQAAQVRDHMRKTVRDMLAKKYGVEDET